MATTDANAQTNSSFEKDVEATQAYIDSPRFEGITRLYTARQVAEQRGTIPSDYPVAREAATAFYPHLRELFAQKKSITTFGPYSPGQAVVMKRMGIGVSTWAAGPLRRRARSAKIPGPTWRVTH